MKNKILLTLITLALFTACTKPGLGGDATLVVFLQHHGRTIVNQAGYPDTVFIKYKAKDLPGTNPSDFDTYFVGEAGEDHIHCEGLKPGQYYIYGTAMDTTGPYRVTGGLGVKITSKEKKKEIDVEVPVVE